MEIVCTHEGIDDGHDNEYKGDDSEEGKTMSGRKVFPILRWLIHSHKFEEEIS
jgi:hypothetical protein